MPADGTIRFPWPATDAAAPADLTLFRDFARGEPAVVTATRNLVGRVVRYRGYFIPDRERADVVQEAMLDVWAGLAQRAFASDGEFFGFVRQVAYRRCIDWIRKHQRRPPVALEAVQLLDPHECLVAGERKRLGTEVVSKLKKPCRDLFALHAGRGMTYGQMAEHFGRSEGALRTQAHECLKAARRLLDRIQRRSPAVVPLHGRGEP